MNKTRYSLFLLTLIMPILLVGCADTYDSAMDDSIKVMESYVSIIEGVTNLESAKAAKLKFEQLTDRLQAIKTRTDGLGEPDLETQERLKEKFKTRMEDVSKRMQAAMMKLMGKPEVMAEMQKSMQSLQELPMMGQ